MRPCHLSHLHNVPPELYLHGVIVPRPPESIDEPTDRIIKRYPTGIVEVRIPSEMGDGENELLKVRGGDG